MLIFHIPNWFTDPLIGSWFSLQLPCKVHDVNGRMMKQKGCGRQQLWLILMYYYIIYVEVLRKTMPNHSDQSPVWNMNHIPPQVQKCANSYPATFTGCAVPSWLHTAPCLYRYCYMATTVRVPTRWTVSSKLKCGCQRRTLWPSTYFTTVSFTFKMSCSSTVHMVQVIPLTPIREVQPSLYAYLTCQMSSTWTTCVESADTN